MKYQTLTDDEVKALRDAKKMLDAIMKRYCKARAKAMHMQNYKDSEEHRRMHKELRSLGIDVNVDSSAEYEEAISFLLGIKTYLLQTEHF